MSAGQALSTELYPDPQKSVLTDGEMTQKLRALALVEARVLFPAPTWLFAAVCNCGSRGSDARCLSPHVVHINTQAHTQKLKEHNNEHVSSFKMINMGAREDG